MFDTWQTFWSELVVFSQAAVVHSKSLSYGRIGVGSFEVVRPVQAVAALAGSAGRGKKGSRGVTVGFSKAEAGE